MTVSRDDLKEILIEIFDERARVDADVHNAHHDWIQARIDAEKARHEMYTEATRTFTQWSVLGLLSFLGGFLSGVFVDIWHWIKSIHWL